MVKVLLVFALVAVMLSTVVVTAKAATYPPVDNDPINPPSGHTHSWVFMKFTWNINPGKRIYKATAVYMCSGCEQTKRDNATVTVAAHICTATVTASQSQDGRAHTQTVCLHDWVFEGFEWEMSHGCIAFGKYMCSLCGEKCLVKATVIKTTKGYRATITSANAPDGVARSGILRIADFIPDPTVPHIPVTPLLP